MFLSTTGDVHIGIAGLGRMGQRHALNIFKNVHKAKLVATCGATDFERSWSKKNFPNVPYYSSYYELLKHPELHAVVLATPTQMHLNQTVMALEQNKHVLTEKPLALNYSDCLQAEDVLRGRNHLVSMVGFVRRFDESYQAAYEKIQKNLIGSPYLVRSQTLDKFDKSGFFVQYAKDSGGIFLDCTIHDIDLARLFLGNPKPLRAYASGVNAIHTELSEHGDVDNGLSFVEFEGGAMATFMASRTQQHGHETTTEIFGTEGKLKVGTPLHREQLEIADHWGTRYEAPKDFYERFKNAFVIEMQAFVDKILEKGIKSNQNKATHRRSHLPPAASVRDATWATRIGCALRESFIEKRIIEL